MEASRVSEAIEEVSASVQRHQLGRLMMICGNTGSGGGLAEEAEDITEF